MLEIGEIAGNRRGEGSTIKGIVQGLKHNKLVVISTSSAYINLPTANQYKRIDLPVFSQWRVIACGMLWITASTANEDPIINFGTITDNDAYGKMTSAITGGEKFAVGDFQKLDPYNILMPEVIAETSATLVTTWTEGVQFNKWQNACQDIAVFEAAVAGMTTGIIRPFVVIEIDTGGKW